MALRPDPLWPTLPPVAATHWQAPVLADTIGNMVAATLHLAGVKFRPATYNLVTYDTSSITGTALGFAPPLEQIDPDGLSLEIHNPIKLSPFATALAVVVGYQAREDASHTPSITASLELKGGAQLDAGIEWTGETLPLKTVRLPFGVLIVETYPIQYVTTGLALGTGTYPRPLDASGGEDSWCDVVVEADHARIVSVSVIEIPDSELA